MGVADDDGYVQIVDRMEDLIIAGGFNIAPSEIEAAISELSGVVEVCVIAASDPEFGETPAAIVHSTNGLTPEEVVSWCSEKLAAYQSPTVCGNRAGATTSDGQHEDQPYLDQIALLGYRRHPTASALTNQGHSAAEFPAIRPRAAAV